MASAQMHLEGSWAFDAVGAGVAASLTRGLALSALSGGLYGLSLTLESPWMRAPLGLVSLAPLLVAIVRLPPFRAAIAAAAWTVVATTVVASWFPSTLQHYFGLSLTQAAVGFALLTLVVNAPPYLVWAVWLSWRTRHGPVSPLVIGAGFLLAETARAVGIVPNPYALLGSSQVGSPTAQLAEWIGGFGLGGLAAAVSAAIAGLVCPVLRGARPLRDGGVVCAATLFALGFGIARLDDEPARDADFVRVGVIQPGFAPARGVAPADDRVATQIALSRIALAAHPDLLFWPEHAVAFYPREASAARATFLAEAGTLGTDLVFGAPHYRNGEPEPDYYASLFLMRDGRLAGRTDKRSLVPFAEYDPLGGLLPVETAGYRSGDSFRPLEARAARVGGFLCGEVLFPAVARELSLAGATVLANPSNDGWFTAEQPARHQIWAARMRAIENRRPVVRSAANGYSAVIDDRGRIVELSGRGTAEILAADIRPSRLTTLYQRHPHALLWAALLAVAGSCTTAARVSQRATGSARIRSIPKGRLS